MLLSMGTKYINQEDINNFKTGFKVYIRKEYHAPHSLQILFNI